MYLLKCVFLTTGLRNDQQEIVLDLSSVRHQSVAKDLLSVPIMSFQVYFAHQSPSEDLIHCLETNGFQCTSFGTAQDLWNSVQRNAPPELILSQILLPDRSGLWLCQQLKSHPNHNRIPVVLMGQNQDEHTRIMSMESGAEDHVPFSIAPMELALRLKRILQHTQLSIRPKKWLSVPPFQIVEESQQVYDQTGEIILTQTEYQLLFALCRKQGQLIPRRTLLNHLWGTKIKIQPRILDTYIKRLRQKLGENGHLIETVHGKGYCLNPLSESITS